jgi:hypothetical protein
MAILTILFDRAPATLEGSDAIHAVVMYLSLLETYRVLVAYIPDLATGELARA